MWQPGDRIFVIGFSRGAYTVRCLAAVLSLCGVPTTMGGGKTPLRRDAKSVKKIASEAVKNVYQHVSSPADEKYVEQRKAIALRFRLKYKSDAAGLPNANPYFIGVFDTVASLGSYPLSAAMFGGAFVLILLLSWLLSILLPFWTVFLLLVTVALAGAGIWYVISHLRYATGLKNYSFWQTLHFTSPKMKFYDPHLDNEVRFARHALSIDENRADFAMCHQSEKFGISPSRVLDHGGTDPLVWRREPLPVKIDIKRGVLGFIGLMVKQLLHLVECGRRLLPILVSPGGPLRLG
jgi:hypothetical protein